VVCNPPWLPGKPSSAIEYAIYDPDSRMLRGFLAGLKDHLLEGGEGWLILSDLAEHLGLRTREQLLGLDRAAGLAGGRPPRHPSRRMRRPATRTIRWRQARMQEVTSLWRLKADPDLHFIADADTIAFSDAGWSSLAARRAHNPKVTGSNPVPATKYCNKSPTLAAGLLFSGPSSA
jgi:methylase of polypeptide subunit release factors